MNEDWLTVTEYAERTGHHFMTVGLYARSGKIPASRWGQRWYIHKDAQWPGPRLRQKAGARPVRKAAAADPDQAVFDLAAKMLPLPEVAKRTGLTVEEVRSVLRRRL